VYRRPSSAKNVVKIFLDGQEAGSLAANSFAQIPWTNKTREVSLCLEENNSSCYSFIPDFTITNYVEVRAKTAAEQPVLLAAPQKEGDFYTKKMRRR
ncbi:MAG TPA: hypothetical protein VK364_07175, partial [Hymenobacter sp.]|nr:hypothetical protein [Hymenobacter sp.]